MFTVEELFPTDKLTEMLWLQERLQRRYYGGAAPNELSFNSRINYIKDMMLATTDELHEALRETPWKPWSKTTEWSPEARNAYVDELVDAWHFFMNLMLVAGVTADELHTRYLRKNNINHGRIEDGYASPTG